MFSTVAGEQLIAGITDIASVQANEYFIPTTTIAATHHFTSVVSRDAPWPPAGSGLTVGTNCTTYSATPKVSVPFVGINYTVAIAILRDYEANFCTDVAAAASAGLVYMVEILLSGNDLRWNFCVIALVCCILLLMGDIAILEINCRYFK